MRGWMLWGNCFVRNCLISYTFLSYIHFHFSSFRVTRQESALLVSRKVHSISLQRTSTTWEPMTGTQTGNLLIKMPALLEFWQHFAKIQIALSLCAVVTTHFIFEVSSELWTIEVLDIWQKLYSPFWVDGQVLYPLLCCTHQQVLGSKLHEIIMYWFDDQYFTEPI